MRVWCSRKEEERARAAALARGRRAHLTKDSSRLLLNLEGVAGSDGVVDALEHRSDGSQAEQMRCPDRRSALAAGSDDSPVSATAGGPALVVRGDFLGSARGRGKAEAHRAALRRACLNGEVRTVKGNPVVDTRCRKSGRRDWGGGAPRRNRPHNSLYYTHDQ